MHLQICTIKNLIQSISTDRCIQSQKQKIVILTNTHQKTRRYPPPRDVAETRKLQLAITHVCTLHDLPAAAAAAAAVMERVQLLCHLLPCGCFPHVVVLLQSTPEIHAPAPSATILPAAECTRS